MSVAALSAQEIERVTVFSYAEPFPIVPEPGIVAVIVDPTNGRIVSYAESVEPVIYAVRKRGMIGYALADQNVPEVLGDLDPYWTVERAQRLYDHHRRAYVNCDDV